MAFKNRSPWIHQLDLDRVAVTLHGDIETDIAIIGAGIAGVSTAFFCLEQTDKKVTLFDGGRLAHGATGHNAGQLTSYFERSLSEIRDEFGDEKTRRAQGDIERTWELLDHMYTSAGLSIPLSRFLGHAGLVDFDRVMRQLGDAHVRAELGLVREEILIAKEASFVKNIPKDYSKYYSLVKQSEILSRLETKDTRFIACLSAQKGCMNSALFCQEIVKFLLLKYPKRFALYEHTHIHKVIVREDHAMLDALTAEVSAHKVVLCTNGFENISLISSNGLDINTKFHHTVRGIIGFMSGYVKKYDKPPIAISYIIGKLTELSGEYFYVTRREFEYDTNHNHNLISVGGPELTIEDTTEYVRERDYPKEAEKEIDTFVHEVFEGKSDVLSQYEFKWHGLMGYTPNGIRVVGEEPKHPVLLYNLGCNGIGILPSIYGGNRIAHIISDKKLLPSIFDPK